MSPQNYLVLCTLHELLFYPDMRIVLRYIRLKEMSIVHANRFSNPIPRLLANNSSVTFFEIPKRAFELQLMDDFEICSANQKENRDYNSVYRACYNKWQCNILNLAITCADSDSITWCA